MVGCFRLCGFGTSIVTCPLYQRLDDQEPIGDPDRQSAMNLAFLIEQDPFGKPLHRFADHAGLTATLSSRARLSRRGWIVGSPIIRIVSIEQILPQNEEDIAVISRW
jgi:hypothetical protein